MRRFRRRCRVALAAGITTGLLLVLLLSALMGCAKPAAPLPPPSAPPVTPPPAPSAPAPDQAKQFYLRAYEHHMAPVDRWLRGVTDTARCYEESNRSAAALEVCGDIYPPASYVPKDRRRGEALIDYVRRKEREWEEKAKWLPPR